nr:MAG TPA: hypothetical protein [Caudoviricetes sp.]
MHITEMNKVSLLSHFVHCKGTTKILYLQENY